MTPEKLAQLEVVAADLQSAYNRFAEITEGMEDASRPGLIILHTIDESTMAHVMGPDETIEAMLYGTGLSQPDFGNAVISVAKDIQIDRSEGRIS